MNPKRTSVLPSTWRVESLGDLASVVYGESLKAEARLGRGGVPVYGSGGIVGEHDTFLHGGPSIVIGRKGSVGALYMVQEPFWAIDTTFFLREVSPEVEVEFLYYALQTRDLARLAIMVGVPGLNRQDLEKQLVPLPTPSEQRHIVAILRQADELRRLRREANQRAKDILPALFWEMFGHPDPDRNDRGWEVVRLGDKVDVGTGGTPSRSNRSFYGGNHLWVKTTELRDNLITATEETLTDEGLGASNAKVFPAETVLVAMYGQGQTRGRTAKLLRPATTNQACAAFYPSSEILPNYLWVWLQISYERIRNLGRGGPQANLNLTIMKQVRIPKPRREAQLLFSAIVDSYVQHSESLDQVTPKYDDLFYSVLSRAFTGVLTATWRQTCAAQLTQEAIERDQRLGMGPKRLLTREDILGTLDSRDQVAAETTLTQALNDVAQQVAGSTRLVSSTLLTLARSPAIVMAQQIQRQYVEMFDSLTLRAVRQIADDQQRILASMSEPLRQMTKITHRVIEDLRPLQGLLAQFAETARLALAEPDPSHRRYHLLRSLSREQHILYLALQTAEGYLRPEAMAEESGLPLDAVQRELDLLVTVGLAQRVNVATKPSDKLVYLPAYRRVRPPDNVRQTMLERLASQEGAP